MILGIGIDLVNLAKMRSLCIRHARRLSDGLFTESELHAAGIFPEQRCADSFELSNESVAYLAGCFAAKEAAVKAMGFGPADFNWSDLEVSHAERFRIALLGTARDKAARKQIGDLTGACSYTPLHAMAIVVGESAS